MMGNGAMAIDPLDGLTRLMRARYRVLMGP